MDRPVSVIVRASMLAAVVVLGRAGLAQVPGSTGDDRGPQFLLAASSRLVPVDLERTPVLRKRISLHLDGATLEEALRAISAQAELDLVYDGAALPRGGRVHVDANSLTVAAALAEVLLDAGLDVVFTPTGRATLVRRAPPVRQQTGTIVGTVTDAATHEPIPAVTLQLEGTRFGALTGNDGRFRIPGVPPGTYALTARRIGYAKATHPVTVVADREAPVDVRLTSSAVELNEIVTTGTGGAVERRKLGTSIGVVDLEKVQEVKPVTDVTQALQAAVPGLRVASVNGGVGAARDLRIRGTSSFSLGQRPVVYIDGVRVDTRATDWTAGLGGQACCNFNGGAAEDRLSDLNPEDIDHIEVLKGAAAATLYGSEATNGVIQIFTKKGRPDSPPQWALDLSTGFDRMRPNFPTKLYPRFVGPDGTRALDMNRTLIKSGLFQGYAVSVSGGAQRATYFVSAAYSDEEGSIQPNDERKGGLHANVSWSPSDVLSFEVRTFFSKNYINALQSGNNWTALTGNASNGNPLNATKKRPYGEAWVSVADIQKMKSVSDANRYTGGITISYQPKPYFSNRFTLGLDATNENKARFFPYEGDYGSAYVTNGEKDDGYRDYRVVTFDYLGQLSFRLPRGIASDFSFGGQGFFEYESLNMAIGKVFAGPGVSTVSAASQTFGQERYAHTVNIGGLAQDRLSFGDHLFATVGVRVDGNSAFGRDYGFQAYPKADAAWSLTGYSWLPTVISSLKLRAAIGTAGKAPGAFDQYQTFRPEAVFSNTPAVYPYNPGNTELAPEKTTEIEAGFDAGFFGDRLGVEASAFRSTTDNAIVAVRLPPSSGFVNAQQRNIGGIENRGWELSLSYLTLARERFSWRNELRFDGTTNKVTDLGGAVGIVDAAGNRVAVGYPVGGVWARYPVGYDQTTKQWIRSDTARYYGPPLPTFNLSYGTTVTWRGLQFYGLLTMERGAWFLNSDRPYRFRQRTGDEYLALLGPNGEPTAASDSALAYWRLFDDPEQRDNVRLRTLSLSYALPERWTAARGLGRTTLTLSANNIMWWDHCHCVDPNMNWNGADPFRTNNGFLADPAPRTYRLALRTHF
jgi:TonB-dependent SusC/RagA subfamily outer membrane receptor